MPVAAAIFTAGLSAAKTGFDLIKGVRELLKRQEVDPSEISSRLLELQELMLEAQTALSEGQAENRRLQIEVEELKRMADFWKEFKSAYGVYWHETYPYCPVCWDVDRKPVRLSGPTRPLAGGHHNEWICPFHKQAISLRFDILTAMKNETT